MVSGFVSLSWTRALDVAFAIDLSVSLAGAIPSSLNPQLVNLGHNLLCGPIPQRLLASSEHAEQKIVVAKALESPTCQQGQHATCMTRKRFISEGEACLGMEICWFGLRFGHSGLRAKF
eukprot:4387123-Amphidinium_carterae.1